MTLPRLRRPLLAGVLLLSALLAAGCTSSAHPLAAGPPRASSVAPSTAAPSSPSTGTPTAPGSRQHQVMTAPAVAVAALRPGQRWIDLPMPGGSYRPQADAGGTDDYRCLLLDPKIATSSFLSGVVLRPGNPALVHHAILYRVDPDQVAAAQAKDASDPRRGWSCFGGPGLPSKGGVIGQLDSAPWVAAWATSGGEQRFAAGTGQQMAAGSRVILQMHYNLLNGAGVDNTDVTLRMAKPGARLQPLRTLLLPAPVELPCPPEESGPLCDRTASVFDVARRFGDQASRTVAGLQLLCGGSLTDIKAGPTQTCARQVNDTIWIRAVAGHMHLLGTSIHVELDRRSGTVEHLIDVPVWNFDDQRAAVLAKPVSVHPGDELRVSCRHDASLRHKLPDLAKLPPRYVVWGEGSSDEMCLGIVSYTKS